MSVPTFWSAGRYESVGERIAVIASEVVDAVARRTPLTGLDVVDLACGPGSAALAAAAEGARVTAVDITPELLAIGAAKPGGEHVKWRHADASETGLADGSCDAIVSNMGIIFVEPERQVVELRRLLKPHGLLSFSTWVRDSTNPMFDPIVAVLGAPPSRGFTPDQWGDPIIVEQRLGADFTDIELDRGTLRWHFASLEAGLHFLEHESPIHVDVFGRVDAQQRTRLLAAFAEAMRPHVGADGVDFDASYAVVTARRQG
jgi:SAM-dependent methyltransferase